MQNKNKELDRLNGVYMKLLNNAGVKYIEGRGKLVDAHTVEVNGKHYTVSFSTWLVAFVLRDRLCPIKDSPGLGQQSC